MSILPLQHCWDFARRIPPRMHNRRRPTGCRSASPTIAWSTVKYATDAENGFVEGSLDRNTIVDRSFKTHVLENRYLKVTLLPEFGGRILSIIYKPTGHEQLYRTEVGVPYGMKAGNFYYDWLMVYGGIFPDLPGCRARQDAG